MIIQALMKVRSRNVILNLFELWVGIAGIASGFVYFYAPASINGNSITITVGHSWAAIWNVIYFIAGLLICYGLIRPSPRWEIVGLYMLGSATAIQGVAIWFVFGLRGMATALTLITLTIASWIRATLVYIVTTSLAKESEDDRVRH